MTDDNSRDAPEDDTTRYARREAEPPGVQGDEPAQEREGVVANCAERVDDEGKEELVGLHVLVILLVFHLLVGGGSSSGLPVGRYEVHLAEGVRDRAIGDELGSGEVEGQVGAEIGSAGEGLRLESGREERDADDLGEGVAEVRLPEFMQVREPLLNSSLPVQRAAILVIDDAGDGAEAKVDRGREDGGGEEVAGELVVVADGAHKVHRGASVAAAVGADALVELEVELDLLVVVDLAGKLALQPEGFGGS